MDAEQNKINNQLWLTSYIKAIELIVVAIKSATLVNGVAGISLLTFWGNSGNLSKLNLSVPLILFSIGVACSLTSAITILYAQHNFANLFVARMEKNKVQEEEDLKWASRQQIASQVLIILSALFFIAGSSFAAICLSSAM